MLHYHQERLYYLLTRHYKYTDSKKAFEVLSHFKKYVNNIKLVFPKDYRNALMSLENNKTSKKRLKG